LEEWTGDVGDLQIVFGKDFLRVGNLRCAEVDDVLAPHGTKLDPAQAKIVRDNVTIVVEILGDLIVDDGNSERRLGCRSHADERPDGVGGSGQTCRSKKAA